MKIFNLLLILTFSLILSNASFAQKISTDELVAKHIASIGTKEKLQSVKNQVLFGDIQFKFVGSATVVGGKIVVASANEKSLWGMELGSNDYPSERFGYDGKDARIAFTRPGLRSILGAFINSYPEILREGLLGGSLTSSWALMNTAARKPKISFEGTKKINDKEAYVLSYSPKGGSDLSIKMYFDKDTYHHVRTEYNRVVGARIGGGGVDSSASQGENRYKMIEDFSDFKDAGGLMLPSTYKIYYSFSSSAAAQSANNPSREAEWKFSIANFSYNQQLDDNTFNINTTK